MEDLLRGRDGSPKYPDLSLHGYRHAPQNHAIFDTPPHLLATIPQSPTASKAAIDLLGLETISFPDYLFQFTGGNCAHTIFHDWNAVMHSPILYPCTKFAGGYG